MQASGLGNHEHNRGAITLTQTIKNQLVSLSGVALLVSMVFLFISLATWKVDDPSFSLASDAEIRNWMGYPGAVLADLAMQFLGLASAIALVAPALWGWSRLLKRPLIISGGRTFTWILGALCGAAGLASLPISAQWPLPVGLGGVTGDMILRGPEILLGPLNGWMAVVIATPFFLACLYLTCLAGGLLGSLPTDPADAFDPAEFDVEDEDDDTSSWALGMASHYWFALKARLGFNLKSARNVEALADENAAPAKLSLIARLSAYRTRLLKPEDDGLEDLDANQSAPSDMGYGKSHMDVSIVEGPAYGEEVHDPYLERETIDAQWAEQPAPATNTTDDHATATPFVEAAASTRVVAPASPPKASTRVAREAQPSLIKEGDFELPSLHFLQDVLTKRSDLKLSPEALEQNARMLEGVLEDFGVKGEIINVRPGPVVTLYELEPAPGIKSSRVIGLADDIARSMSAIAARVAVVPGRNAIGIELPNADRETVYLREILASQAYDKNKAKLPLILGKTIGGEPTIADLAKMPHLLVAGTTGSGKSVAINTMILSILYRMSPEQVKMIMIDPKMLELSIYDGIPHLLTPVVTDPKKAVVALKWTVREMEDRYRKMSKLGVRNIDGYNSRVAEALKKGETMTRTIQTGFDKETGEAVYETEELAFEAMPYIVIVIDEMADLMMVAGKDIEGAIQRLAQMARAAGIHVIMATQRPSVDVITGTIKANFPTRISFQVTSKIDSRTILGEQGAEQLLGMGDMLYMAGGGRIQRVHGPFVADEEVDQVVNHLKAQGIPQYLDSVTEEDEEAPVEGSSGSEGGGLADSNDIYDQAVAVVLRDRKVSTSYIQRRLGIGYNRAASLIERMEQEGLIGAANHAGKREILVPAEDETI